MKSSMLSAQGTMTAFGEQMRSLMTERGVSLHHRNAADRTLMAVTEIPPWWPRAEDGIPIGLPPEMINDPEERLEYCDPCLAGQHFTPAPGENEEPCECPCHEMAPARAPLP